MMCNRITVGMTIIAHRICVAGIATLSVVALLGATPARAADAADARASLVQLAADRIDSVLREVAASTKAIGEEYGAIANEHDAATERERTAWARRSISMGDTTEFRTWPKGLTEPAAQAPYPGIYNYRGKQLDDRTVAQLRDFERLVPVLRSAYRSFDFSWVYLSTVDEMMVIYPYVPMDQAVNNAMPTQQVYYTAADFKRRTVGWTAPYLDLVGAGMMITASYPMFAGDRLLGVASRDITLKQLSRSVLSHLSRDGAASAFIVDSRGLAIDASDAALAAELERVNNQKKAAALFYRTPAGRAQLADRNAVASGFEWANEISESVLARAAASGKAGAIEVAVGPRRALAARVDSTGWFVVLVDRTP